MIPRFASTQPLSRPGRASRPAWYMAGLVLLLLLGFGFRLSFLLGFIYHPDEFITMLAAKMVAERGLPILPSGLFYDHGLLYSFLAGGFIALLDFSEKIARWPALLIGVVTIAAYYATARRLFGSPATGLLAAALVTFDELSLKWGAWARMYDLAHLFVLLSLAWSLSLILKRPGRGSPYLLLLFLAAALFSHTLTFFILPPLVLLSLVLVWFYRHGWLHHRHLWWGTAAGLAIMVIALTVVALGHVWSTASLQGDASQVPLPPGLAFLRGYLWPGLAWSRFSSFVKFFLEPPYTPLLVLAAGTLMLSVYRLLRGKATVSDVVLLSLALFIGLVILEMGVLLAPEWRKGIYMFLLTFPAFLLLSAEGLARLWQGVVGLVARWSGPFGQARLKQLEPVMGLILVGALWGPAAWHTAHGQATGDYDTAFAFVKEHRQPGDKIMTEHPAAAYLYLAQNDYYANQVTAKVLSEDESEHALVDRYTGSPLVDTVEALNAALANGQRVWFVVGKDHLNKYYDSLFHQQIFAQMDLVRQLGEKYIFLSRPYPRPVPTEPAAALDGNFNDMIRLEGYSLDPAAIAPDGTVVLGLYWRPVSSLPAKPFKVFVQLRNAQGQTVAQADHFIFDGLLTSRRWDRLREEGQWLRDTADLALPPSLPPEAGPYRLYVGLYDPDTFERVPVLNDNSGENAVVIDYLN